RRRSRAGAEARAAGDAGGDQGRQDAANDSAGAPVAAERHADPEGRLRRHRQAGRLMRSAPLVALVVLGASAVGRAGELEQLRNENAQLRARVQELEGENTRLRGDASRGLSAALEQRATAAVAVAPGETPGATNISTEASRLEGIGGGKSRPRVTWRAGGGARGGRPGSAARPTRPSAPA